ncbi:MAG: hypothetical protein P8N56_05410 [Schleiferiaceae bacterium]|nr:hypothetical protein [Schleiferiaceae bacterium]
MRILSILLVAGLLLSSFSARSQGNAMARPRQSTPVPLELNSQKGGMIHVALGAYTPTGFWRQRYGNVLDIQTGYTWINGAHLFGFEGGAMYTNQVKDLGSVLNFLLTPEGEILSNDGSYSSLRVEMRGWQLGAHIGQRYPLNALGSAKSSWFWKLKGGVMQHKLAFMSSGGVPMLASPYTYGMDELQRGGFVGEEIGFLHLGRVAPHFQLSILAFQGWMQPIRGYNFSLGGIQTEAKLNFAWGIRGTWILPLLQEKSAIRFYY